MTFVFLMDPLETVDPKKDTTWILMVGAVRAGHAVRFLPDGGLSLEDGQVRFQTVQVTPAPERTPPFLHGERGTLSPEQIDAVFIRTNPPFNERYLFNTWMLDHLPPSIPVINRPAGIRTVNEKLWATQFAGLIPRTLVSRDLAACRAFVEAERDVIVKPPDGFGGMSVFHLRHGDSNVNVTLETLSQGGRKELIVQRYVRDAEVGDKRILLLNGEPLGAVLRVHAPGDHRNNFFSGGHPEPTEITDSDRRIIAALKAHLRRLGLYLVGIDVIGPYLIEVNVTSPTCLQEMNRLSGQALENRVIAFVEQLVARARHAAQDPRRKE